MAQKKLAHLRDRLDDLDGRLLDIVSERLEVAREVAKVKQESPLQVLDAKQESLVLERIGGLATQRGIDSFFAKRLYALLIEKVEACRNPSSRG